MNFLSAQWNHLLLANYIVDRDVLENFLPAKTSLDKFDGHIYVSLVAFLFDRTKVLGVPVPFHRRFEEVNLRFYVTPDKDRSMRAVTFIKEIVPKRAIPVIANGLFGENYVAVPMDHQISSHECSYSWGDQNQNRFSARIDSELSYPAQGSVGEFITEHYWGYAKGLKHTLEYHVTHPQWKCCAVHDFEIAVDFEKTYGSEFAFMNSLSPHNVQYSEGSAVSVSFPKRI